MKVCGEFQAVVTAQVGEPADGLGYHREPGLKSRERAVMMGAFSCSAAAEAPSADAGASAPGPSCASPCTFCFRLRCFLPPGAAPFGAVKRHE